VRLLRVFFLVTDVGFIVYWAVTLLHAIPQEWLFKDYTDPVMVAWNWSFFPLDMAISASGLTCLWLRSRANPRWQKLALISLTLTFCSGLMAISFWALRGDFDPAWWAVNAYLLVYPLFFIRPLLSSDQG
jgi:hypothetical protein